MPDTLAFLPGMTEHLGYYVYALRDPRPGRGIFYVGKGVGDRVYHHARAALVVPDDEPGQNLKLDTIREIHREKLEVGVEIIRHRLTEPEAYEVEAGVIDALILTGVPLTNKVIGMRSRARGWHPLDELRALYMAKDLDKNEITDRLILMKITRLYRSGMSEAELYEVTRGWWYCAPKRHKPELALALYDGVVRAVYRIHDWEVAAGDEGKRRQRRGFRGEMASDKVEQYVWRSVRHLVKKSQNPIQYLNC